MESEEYIKLVDTLLNSLTPQHRDALVEFRDSLTIGVEMFKRYGMVTKFIETELELVNRKLAELDSLE